MKNQDASMEQSLTCLAAELHPSLWMQQQLLIQVQQNALQRHIQVQVPLIPKIPSQRSAPFSPQNYAKEPALPQRLGKRDGHGKLRQLALPLELDDEDMHKNVSRKTPSN
jgi:hypothetical protein